jgi:poly-gamma-glutamate capsule biosynthesis protein CapA/YwtB (metallophosphatase superfamily)
MKKISYLLIVLSCLGAIGFTLKLTQKAYSEIEDVELSKSLDTNSIRIKAVGDIMLASTYPNTSRMPPQEGAVVLEKVKENLADADITFGNLEGPLVDGGVSSKCRQGSTQCFAFRTPTSYAKYLKAAGFDVMSTANNHAGDFGVEGRSSTRKALDSQGIKYAGDETAGFAETIVEINGQKVGFIAFGHNPDMLNINDISIAEARVKKLSEKVDITVVSFHGGAEGSGHVMVPSNTENFLGESRGNLPDFSKAVIDAGADLVLGHGPHVLRGIDSYKNRLIVYSMRNFATYGWFQLYGETAQTAIFEFDLNADGSLKTGKIHPYLLENRGIPTPDHTIQSIKQIQKLNKNNFNNHVIVTDDGVISISKSN